MWQGTSPSITGDGSSYMTGFETNTFDLYLYGLDTDENTQQLYTVVGAGSVSTGITMESDTTPSLAVPAQRYRVGDRIMITLSSGRY